MELGNQMSLGRMDGCSTSLLLDVLADTVTTIDHARID